MRNIIRTARSYFDFEKKEKRKTPQYSTSHCRHTSHNYYYHYIAYIVHSFKMNFPSIKQLQLNALDSLKTPIKTSAAPSASSSSSTPRATPKAAPKTASKPTISIQHMSAQKAKTHQRMLYDVINYLRDIDKPATAEDIHAATGFDIKTTPGMMEALQSNVKISFEDPWFTYKVVSITTCVIIYIIIIKRNAQQEIPYTYTLIIQFTTGHTVRYKQNLTYYFISLHTQ